MSSSQGRILLDVPCKVCADNSSGKHYGIYACDGCAGFFKRSIRRGRQYRCKTNDNSCTIDKTHRNQCRSCRLRKCLEAGMNPDAVQQERGPRNASRMRNISSSSSSQPAELAPIEVLHHNSHNHNHNHNLQQHNNHYGHHHHHNHNHNNHTHHGAQNHQQQDNASVTASSNTAAAAAAASAAAAAAAAASRHHQHFSQQALYQYPSTIHEYLMYWMLLQMPPAGGAW